MKPHRPVLLGLLLLVGCKRADTSTAAAVPDAGPRRVLAAVGPRLLSNQSSQPLTITGEGLAAGMTLQLGAPLQLTLPLTVLDARHAYARLPAHVELGAAPEVLVEARVPGLEGTHPLRLINDTGFPDLTALVLSLDGRLAFALSSTNDTLYRVDLATGAVSAFATDDGPAALATWAEGSTEWIVVAHRYAPTLVLFSAQDPTQRRSVPAPPMAAGLAIVGDVAWVAEQARDTVVALELPGGRERWRTPVAPNPRELAVVSTRSAELARALGTALAPRQETPVALAVGSFETGEVELLAVDGGAPLESLEPGPGTPIVGGTTAKYARDVMNGKAPRSLAWWPERGALFVSSIGPNVGPNADQMEVSMNGGVGVVRPRDGWQRHLGFGAGVTEALALDGARGLLYASDMGLGLVRVLDAKALADSEASAAKALVQELALPVPADFPLVRPAADFNVKGRAGPSLHTGPRALALSPDARTLYVLERFTGALSVVDVSRRGKAEWKRRWPVVDTLRQQTRRLGQVLFHADLGRTAMSCDACHPEGHNEGVLFEKTMPLRIYRSTTVRGSRETAPYFTPASTRSMGETAKVVGGRNRFHNPDPEPTEVEALALYSSLIPTLPNPFVGPDGAPAETLTLPDGKVGSPRRGLALFEGKADCARCHPAPHYTLDQDPATRGQFLDVGTPRFMPLRPEQQNTRFEGFGTPALVGSWDVFPMLTTGLAGLEVKADGRVRVATRFPLRAAVENWAPSHGRADLLSTQERDDLLAFVMSL